MTNLMTEYDYNVWSDEDNKLTLTAYRVMEVDLHGEFGYQTDTEIYESITFKLPHDHEEVLYLIDRPDPEKQLADYGLEDYDDWVSQEFLDRGMTPDRILKFIQDLPNYVPRTEKYTKENA